MAGEESATGEFVFGGRALLDEVELDGRPLRRATTRTPAVRRVQEWLTLNGLALVVDGDFGPATESCVEAFQRRRALPPTGAVDAATYAALVEPLRAVLRPVDPRGGTLNRLIVAYGRRHVSRRPREVGGPNRGPWVRLYMDGNEGAEWFWCAGFATYPVAQAAATLETPLPVLRSFGVAEIAARAQSDGRFLGLPRPADRARITPGSLFLERGGPSGYVHCGLVVAHDGEIMRTLEGNSNEDGRGNGYEAVARTRTFAGLDFVVV